MIAPTPDQRAVMYGDLYQLLVPGFLSAKVVVNGHVLSLRSLSNRDLFLLAGVVQENSPEWRLWAVAASVWMVDGISLLEGGPWTTKTLYDHLKRSHRVVVRALFAQVMTFFQRSRNTLPYLEAFLYEEESRRLWNSTMGGLVTLADRTGVPGAGALGMNMVQASWSAYNRLEDEREEYERLWNLAKVNVALQSAKSNQKLAASDKARLEAERNRRLEVQTRAYQIYIGETSAESRMVEKAGLKVHSTSTPEDLFEEMRRILAGEQDEHDIIVSGIKERMRQEHLDRELERARIVEAARARRAREERDIPTQGRSRIVAFTPEEIAERFPQGQSGAKTLPLDERKTRAFDRYIREEAPVPTTDLIEANLEVRQTPRDRVQDLIESRRPKFNVE